MRTITPPAVHAVLAPLIKAMQERLPLAAGLLRDVRAVSRTYPKWSLMIALVMERLADWPDEPIAAYNLRKPHALWTQPEINAWQRDYPGMAWDVWCVLTPAGGL